MLNKLKSSFRKTSIAWAQLKYQKSQTIAAILGIAFTTILIFMQIGFRTTFLNSLTELPESFQADIFLMSSSSVSVLRPEKFSQRRLNQLRRFSAVESTTPLYYSSVSWRNPKQPSRYARQVAVLGFPPQKGVISLKGVDQNIELLKLHNAVLLDQKSRPEFDPYISKFKNQGKFDTEITIGTKSKYISVSGLFELGASTSYNSTLITSQPTFLEIFNTSRNLISLGLIKIKPEYDVEQVAEIIRKKLAQDVKVLTKKEVMATEKDFYENNTPIGVIFRFGLVASIFVGTIILYQILYIKVSKHLIDYATLKAIGFTYNSLVSIVFKEALILAILGYIPGFILSFFVYEFLANSTRMNFIITLEISTIVFICICAICLVSAGIAINKIKEANPADIF